VWPSRHVTDLSSGLFRLKLSSHFECMVVIVSFRAVDLDAECEASQLYAFCQPNINSVNHNRMPNWDKNKWRVGIV
jgi:hypothetical protein